MNTTISGLLAILLYLLASVLLFARLSRGTTGPGTSRSAILLVGVAALLAHGVLLFPSIMAPGGLNLGFINAASLVALITAAVLVVASFQEPVENLGIPVFPIAAISIVLVLMYPTDHLITGASTGWQLDAHILISLFAYSILGLAVLQALLLAIQEYHLHNRQPGGFIRSLPPLQTMESLMFQMIGVGFALLTLALVTGILFLEDIFAQHLVHKTVLSIVAWCVFALLLWGRWRFGWRGRVAIRWTVGGFIFLMLAYFGSKLVLELILNR
ncbi:MAG: cytochrome c biogenesis protein CcsA [Gammaproteobacteria bacterium]|nr:MAG: cytochrome c biogenesis protein CcsA [Gammaproteobacteria bacterium]